MWVWECEHGNILTTKICERELELKLLKFASAMIKSGSVEMRAEAEGELCSGGLCDLAYCYI